MTWDEETPIWRLSIYLGGFTQQNYFPGFLFTDIVRISRLGICSNFNLRRDVQIYVTG